MLIPHSLLPIAKCSAKEGSNIRYTQAVVYAERLEDDRASLTVTDGHKLITVKFKDDDPQSFPSMPGVAANASEHRPAFNAKIPTKTWLEAGKQIDTKSTFPILSNMLLVETLPPPKKAASKNESDEPTKLKLLTTDLETVRSLDTKEPVGTFPDYKAVLPKEEQRRIVHDKMRLDWEQEDARKDFQKLWVKVCVDPRLLSEVLLTIAEIKTKNGDDDKSVSVELCVPMGCDSRPIMLKAKSGDRAVEITGVVMPMSDGKEYERFNPELHYASRTRKESPATEQDKVA